MYVQQQAGLLVALNYTSVCVQIVYDFFGKKKRDRKKVVCDYCPTRAPAVPRVFCRGEKRGR